MQSRQINRPHLLEVLGQQGLVSFPLTLGPSVSKILEPITLRLLRFFKDEVFPTRVTTDIKSMMCRSWPLEQRSRFAESILRPRITSVSYDFIIEISGYDFIEICRCFFGRVYSEVSLTLDFSDDLCNIRCRDFSLKWDGAS